MSSRSLLILIPLTCAVLAQAACDEDVVGVNSGGSDGAATADLAVPDLTPPDQPLPTCTDQAKNGDETDVDCGGGVCPKCADGKVCLKHADCKSGVCKSGICAAASCTDKVKNGAETDVDCGGGTCPACADTKQCAKNSDCSSGV